MFFSAFALEIISLFLSSLPYQLFKSFFLCLSLALYLVSRLCRVDVTINEVTTLTKGLGLVGGSG